MSSSNAPLQASEGEKTPGRTANDERHALRGTHMPGRSKSSTPVVPWVDVNLALLCEDIYLAPNVVRFMLPDLKREDKGRAREQLAEQFKRVFPNKTMASIRFPDDRHVDIETFRDNVEAEAIVAAASTERWSVLHKPLGPPAIVGPPIPFHHYVIKVSNLPGRRWATCLDLLQDLLPPALSRGSDVAIKIVDAFYVEDYLPLADIWTFSNGVAIVLHCSAKTSVPTMAHSWPGYIQWNPNEVMTLEYMNCFKYCEICKHTAQELDGPNARHETSACPKRTGQQA